MKGLYLKDWYSVRSLGRVYYIGLFGFMTLMAYLMKNAMYMTTMGIMVASNLLFLIFTGEEQGGREFLLQLPISKKQLVVEKYLFSLGFYSIYHVFAGVISCIIALAHKESLEDAVCSFCIMLALNVVLMALMLPVIFLWGVNRARVLMIVGFMILAIVLFASFAFLKSVGGGTEQVSFQNEFLIAIIVGALVVYVVSGLVTVRAFVHKEE